MVLPSFAIGFPPRPLRVLVADDNPDATDTLAVLLRMAGCDVAVAYEGFAVVLAGGAVRAGRVRPGRADARD